VKNPQAAKAKSAAKVAAVDPELGEEKKKALELAARAEHEMGRKREALQAEARRKAESG
jgi:hypothetical protein